MIAEAAFVFDHTEPVEKIVTDAILFGNSRGLNGIKVTSVKRVFKDNETNTLLLLNVSSSTQPDLEKVK